MGGGQSRPSSPVRRRSPSPVGKFYDGLKETRRKYAGGAPTGSHRSEWATYGEHKSRGTQFKPGDALEFKVATLCDGPNNESAFLHYGIYDKVGDSDRVIHNPGKGLSQLLKGRSDPISDDSLRAVAGNCEIRVNNDLDHKTAPFDSEEILRRAYSKIGEKKYNLFTNNCEHFVNECRNGESVRTQGFFAGHERAGEAEEQMLKKLEWLHLFGDLPPEADAELYKTIQTIKRNRR